MFHSIDLKLAGPGSLVDVDLGIVSLSRAVRAASVLDEAFKQCGESGDLVWMLGFKIFRLSGIGGEVEKLHTWGVCGFFSGTWLAPPA